MSNRRPTRDLATTAERREEFELVFQREDPWEFLTSCYEHLRHQATLDMVPAGPVALEVGCAEGIFTGLLAGRAKEVVAFDISPTALQRARARCRDQANISFMVADLVTVEFERRFDVIVVTEVLGYLDERLTLPSLIKMTNWLRAGGILISNPAHGTEGNWQWLLKQSGLDFVAQQTVSCEGKECVILCAKKGEAADG